MKFSLIICTHNGGRRLFDVVNAIQKGKKRPDEIIIVDNNSGEFTKRVVKQIVSSESNVRIIEEVRQGLSYAREAGVRLANSDYVCFIDDDALVTDDFLLIANNIVDKNMPDYFGGMTRLKVSAQIPEWFIENNLFHFYAIGSLYEKSKWLKSEDPCLWGVGLFVKTSCYLQILHTFEGLKLTGRRGEVMLAGDDSEICYQLSLTGCKGYFDPSLVLIHAIDTARFNHAKVLQTIHGFGVAHPVLEEYRIRLLKRKTYLVRFYNNRYCRYFYCLIRIILMRIFQHSCFRREMKINFYEGVIVGLKIFK